MSVGLTLVNQGENSVCAAFKNFFFFWICLFLWLRQVFVPACGLPLVVVSRGCSSQWSACFSLPWLLSLRSTGSRCSSLVAPRPVYQGSNSCPLHWQVIFFNWRIIALHRCVRFCPRSPWISLSPGTPVPSLLSLFPTSHPSRLAPSTWFELPVSW